LTPRDANANNIARVLDFANPVTDTVTYDVPSFDGTLAGCSAQTSGAEYREWPALKKLAIERGWKVP
jgi:phospholipase C